MEIGGARVADVPVAQADRILTPEALGLVVELHRRFEPRRREVLARRPERRKQVSSDGRLGLDPATREIREDDTWRVAAAPADLNDRRVEITGPTDAKMLINAWNSGARIHLADFEDANAPTWSNLVVGQANLIDANRRELTFTAPDGRVYQLTERTAVPLIRPRGWHLTESHVTVDGEPVSAGIFDFALYLHHNAKYLLEHGSGPYFYLPKLESHHEAQLWNDIFVAAQEQVGIPRGSIRATVLIETITAASNMDEILFALREHSSGLNAGRWDYLFSIIKTFRDQGREFVLPDRNSVTMTAPFMRAYTELLVHTCHKRGAFAIGGMAAFIPSRRDPEVNEAALEKVRQDKLREAGDGFDGSWVAHPDLVPVAMKVFDDVLGDRPNQLDNIRDDVHVDIAELTDITSLTGPGGASVSITETGLRNNISVSLQYMAAWLGGSGAVAIFNLMEDVATAEIARSQIWQWRYNGVTLDTGATVTAELISRLIDEEYAKCAALPAFDEARFKQAREALERFVLSDSYDDFLTLSLYRDLS
jgi:malate synthase